MKNPRKFATLKPLSLPAFTTHCAHEKRLNRARGSVVRRSQVAGSSLNRRIENVTRARDSGSPCTGKFQGCAHIPVQVRVSLSSSSPYAIRFTWPGYDDGDDDDDDEIEFLRRSVVFSRGPRPPVGFNIKPLLSPPSFVRSSPGIPGNQITSWYSGSGYPELYKRRRSSLLNANPPGTRSGIQIRPSTRVRDEERPWVGEGGRVGQGPSVATSLTNFQSPPRQRV